jgi:hypothetical protein
MNLELGKSYWLKGYGKVWITQIISDVSSGAAFMAKCQNVNKKDKGIHYIECFEEIE